MGVTCSDNRLLSIVKWFPYAQHSVTFASKYNTSRSWKCYWVCRLHHVKAYMYQQEIVVCWVCSLNLFNLFDILGYALYSQQIAVTLSWAAAKYIGIYLYLNNLTHWPLKDMVAILKVCVVRDLFPGEILTKLVICYLLKAENYWNSAQINLSSSLNFAEKYFSMQPYPPRNRPVKL